MKKDTHRRYSKAKNRTEQKSDDYEFSEEYVAEDSRLIEVKGTLSPLLTFISITLLILFTIYLIAIKHSGGKVTSPKEAVSDFFMPFRSDYYDMRVDYASGLASNNEVCTKFMEENGYSNDLKTSAFNRNTIMQLEQEDGKSYTLPGAYGSTTFYIKPRKEDADLTIHIEYDVYGIKQLNDGSLTRVSDICCETNAERETYESVEKLINGHILFFENRINGKYSGLIEDGKMTYRTTEHYDDLNGNGEYKIKVYWIWAEYYEQLVNAQTDGALFENSEHQSDMIDYIEDNTNEFFYAVDGEPVPTNTDIIDYSALSDYYDSGDKLIVENTNYFGFNVHTYAE